MSRSMLRAILVLAVTAGWPMMALGSGAREVESQILQLEDRWRVAQHRNDEAAFMALLAPDATFIGTSGSLRDRADYIASRETSSLPRAETYEFSELHVRVFGAVAIVTGREATTGEGVAFQGRFTHVWAKTRGVWQLEAIQRTDIAK